MKPTLAAIVLALLSTGCAGPEVRGPFRNQYIDAETGKPIEGVVFLAEWYTTNINFVDGGGESFYAVQEAVSDRDGLVEIPGVPVSLWRFPLNVRFREFNTHGYVASRLKITPSDRAAYVNPTVTLMRQATREERCDRLPYASGMVSAAAAQRSPLYIGAVARERKTLSCR